MKERSVKKFGYCCIAASAICVICYLGAASKKNSKIKIVGGYLNFGVETLGNILNNYEAKGKTKDWSLDIPAAIAKIGFSFTLVFHYPLVFHNLRNSLSGLITPNLPDTLWYRFMYYKK